MPILLKLEKKLCKNFKDVLESRELARKFRSPFSIKMNVDRKHQINEKDENYNSSYRKIDHSLLINPEFREKSFLQEKHVQVIQKIIQNSNLRKLKKKQIWKKKPR